ncbi:acetoacetate--CoA ligase [Thermoleophilia bacterium SCSIO 60948]|nr:acetoacetate--CoA ligase [Thermoleophilia bacterium SCSIO 60948]
MGAGAEGAGDDAPAVLWEPSADRLEDSNLTHFAAWLSDSRGLELGDAYGELWQWSVDHPEDFWGSIAEYFDVEWDAEPESVLGDASMPGAKWFPGGRTNYARHVFRDRDPEAVAVRHASELRELAELTWGELESQVAAAAAGMRSLGVEPGDRVVAYLPNTPEALVAFLAAASLGAVWSSCSPDFGASSVVDRFAQIEPKLLITVDGYRYGGKDFDRLDVVRRLGDEIDSLERTVLLGYLDPDSDPGALDGAISWDELLEAGAGSELSFEPLDFDHPLWVLYSSGTTGLPKAIVQGHGGILVEHLKKLHLHVDAREDDRVFWFTTTGWMMWNFLVSGLLTRASIVLYDGNPGSPDMGVLWDLAERAGVTIFGTSASYIAACMKDGLHPADGRDLSRIAAVGSTGSPLAPEGFDWIADELGADVWIFSTSGGTDVCTAFVGGVPTLPVYRGELQARALGADVQAFDLDGEPVLDELGELVITQPMPSMPLYLWGDDDGSRMRESYFDTYPGIWRHGDWIEIFSDRGTAKITGRSDSTINRGGIRMGSAEIYRAVATLDEVVDALVVDVPREGEENWLPLFVVLREGAELDDELVGKIRATVRERCSPRHVPSEVRRIDEIPRTLSGKALEVPVKRILMGADPDDVASRDSLHNPDALDPFVELARTG